MSASTPDNRIDRRFRQLRDHGRKALIPYLTAGYPAPEATVASMHACVSAGADLLELGIPFSDVMADGPVIQEACRVALERGMTLAAVLSAVEEFRQTDADTPVILMGYMNPLERRGLEEFARRAADAGVDGMLIVDCPAEEADRTRQALRARGLHQIFLVAPTTTPERMQRIAPMTGGFIYYVSLKGVTGAASLALDSLAPALAAIRRVSDLPVAVGFGIATARQAAAVARVADAVVIGSALVQGLQGADDPDEAGQRIAAFLEPVREAMDNGCGNSANGQVANA